MRWTLWRGMLWPGRFRLGWQGVILLACITGLIFGFFIPPVVHRYERPNRMTVPLRSAGGPAVGVEHDSTVVPAGGEFARAKDEDFSER